MNEENKSKVPAKPTPPPAMPDATDQVVDLVALSDQAILMGSDWSDSRGHTIKLMLNEGQDGGHPLKGFSKGTRFHLVLVELEDGEEPVNQKLKKKLEGQLQKASKGGKHSQDCGMLCKVKDFHRYLLHIGKMRRDWDEETRIAMAREHVLKMLKIKSRREIDQDAETIAAYHNLIVDPYYEYMRNRTDKTT
jgi:hypothetical protein